jgi:histidinol dehydrogenase
VNPHTLVAAAEAGVTEIYRVGGAQAVAALAYGTETVARVDKIVGPGNIYVTAAKRQVFGAVDIDMLAGPSEVLIVADDSARPEFVAADMLAQAEHDELASSILVTPHRQLAEKVQQEIDKQLAKLNRRLVAEKSINERGAIIITATLDEAVQVANAWAPEHLELMVADPYRWLGSVTGAGAVFLGHFSPEPVGDYLAGPNHVLPTGGTARFISPLNVDTFIKKTSIIGYAPRALARDGEHIVALAETEGLDAHAASVQYRLAALADSPVGGCTTTGETSSVANSYGLQNLTTLAPKNNALGDLPGLSSIKPGFGDLPGRVPPQKGSIKPGNNFNRLHNNQGEGERR